MGRSAVIHTVVEVGPVSIRGSNAAPGEWVSTAIDCIDDRIALLDERLVEVPRLWSDLLEMVAGAHTETVVLVFPTWWSSAHVRLVADAAHSVFVEVVVLQRASILAADGVATVIELSHEFAVVAAPDADVVVLPRRDGDVAASVRGATSVLVDLPVGVSPLAPTVIAQVRAQGIPVALTDRQRVLHAVSAVLPEPRPHERTGRGPHLNRRAVAVLAGGVLSVAAVGGGWAAQNLSANAPTDSSTDLLVEGRVAVRVPSHWAVERITSGAGSARLRVSAPSGELTALHITQSTAATPTTVAEVAESLRRALESESAGVFVDFDPAGRVGDTPAVTYRELRAGSETWWAVVIDGATRIAIGCQSRPADRAAILDVCERAVQSAHEVH